MIYEKIIKEVESVVNPCYLVGGSVRDILLNKTPKDYDFCTPLDPDTIEQKVRDAGRKPYLIGKKFGTVGFKVNVDKEWHYVEVTTFRKESYEEGNRKPKVEFVTDLIDDLSRRDLTINAIALKNGEYFDPFGGRIDILRKRIKAVGEASDRIKEDPLRILRAVRFESQFGFDLDPNFIGKCRKLATRICTISRERWVQEIDKILTNPNSEKGIVRLKDTGVLRFILPELDAFISEHWGTSIYSDFCNNLRNSKTADDGWAEIISAIGIYFTVPYTNEKQMSRAIYPNSHLVSIEILNGIVNRLKFSNDRHKYILKFLQY